MNTSGSVAEALLDFRRFGFPRVQTRRPQHLRGSDPNHSHRQQPQPPGRRSVREHHLRAGQRARYGSHETRRPGGAPGPSAQGYPRTEEDQSRARHRPPVGGAVSDPGGPRLHHDRTQRRKNLQVGHGTKTLPLTLSLFCRSSAVFKMLILETAGVRSKIQMKI